MLFREPVTKTDAGFVAAVLTLCLILVFLPAGFTRDSGHHSERVKVLVLETDNSGVVQYGIVRQGDQYLKVRILSGPRRGSEFDAGNMLIGKLEFDKMFVPGDRAFAVLDLDPSSGKVTYVNVLDHYRIGVELLLFILFFLLLIAYAGWTGLRAFLSFVFAVLLIWKVYVPGLLKDLDPLFVTLAVVTLLSVVIILLIGGINRKGLAAFLGTISGVVITMALSLVFSRAFRIHGAVKPFSETLLYSGYPHLDLTRIFISSIFLGASGAVMDLSMDIASAQHEIRQKHPAIGAGQLIRSGFVVGRAVVGTMTTTLLLAYSSSFITLLMVFMAQGIPLANMLNLSYAAAEILHTLVGSFGLVTVGPLTALFGGILLTESLPRLPGKKQPKTRRKKTLYLPIGLECGAEPQHHAASSSAPGSLE